MDFLGLGSEKGVNHNLVATKKLLRIGALHVELSASIRDVQSTRADHCSVLNVLYLDLDIYAHFVGIIIQRLYFKYMYKI